MNFECLLAFCTTRNQIPNLIKNSEHMICRLRCKINSIVLTVRCTRSHLLHSVLYVRCTQNPQIKTIKFNITKISLFYVQNRCHLSRALSAIKKTRGISILRNLVCTFGQNPFTFRDSPPKINKILFFLES